MSSSDIISQVAPYLDYLSAPIFVFVSLAAADLLVGFVIDTVRKTRRSYRA